MTKKKPFLLGAHISIAGGLEMAIARGESIGCTTIQIFTKSNRQWRARPITEQEEKEFKNATKKSFICPIVAHASYLINIGAPEKEIEKKSVEALKIELARCEQLGLPYLILHPGSHKNQGEQACLDRIAHNLDEVLKEGTGKTKILLETMAGQGSSVGCTFEHIAYIRKQTHHKRRLGVCFDTCHAFVAGYDYTNPQKYEDMWQEFDRVIGLEHLKVIHINESKRALGERVDRHEHIGKGKIGTQAFKMLFNDPRFFDIPKILETPKDSLKEDLDNMHRIVKLLSPKTKNTLEIKVKKEYVPLKEKKSK